MRIALAALLLAACSSGGSRPAPVPGTSATIQLRPGEEIVATWGGACPSRPDLGELHRGLEKARARALQETGVELGYGGRWFVYFRPLMPSRYGHYISASPPAFAADCNWPSVAAHEPGHVWAAMLRRDCWADVWHTVDLLCRPLPRREERWGDCRAP